MFRPPALLTCTFTRSGCTALRPRDGATTSTELPLPAGSRLGPGCGSPGRRQSPAASEAEREAGPQRRRRPARLVAGMPRPRAERLPTIRRRQREPRGARRGRARGGRHQRVRDQPQVHRTRVPPSRGAPPPVQPRDTSPAPDASAPTPRAFPAQASALQDRLAEQARWPGPNVARSERRENAVLERCRPASRTSVQAGGARAARTAFVATFAV
jgi:hypothetical protein